MLRATVIVCGILLGLLVAAIGTASTHGHVIDGLRRLIADPWGIVTLLDLGVGLIFVAAWITIMEPRPLHAAVWVTALFLLGNVVTLVFLIWRTRYVTHFAQLFSPLRRGDRASP